MHESALAHAREPTCNCLSWLIPPKPAIDRPVGVLSQSMTVRPKAIRKIARGQPGTRPPVDISQAPVDATATAGLGGLGGLDRPPERAGVDRGDGLMGEPLRGELGLPATDGAQVRVRRRRGCSWDRLRAHRQAVPDENQLHVSRHSSFTG